MNGRERQKERAREIRNEARKVLRETDFGRRSTWISDELGVKTKAVSSSLSQSQQFKRVNSSSPARWILNGGEKTK